jgi:hypothetical protein
MAKREKRNQKRDIQKIPDHMEWEELKHLLKVQPQLKEILGYGALAKAEIEAAGERSVSGEPPKPAEYLAYLFLPKADRETLLGDLTEEYPALAVKFGRRGAQFYFYKQVIWSIWPLVRKTIVKWGLFGWVVELIRKIGS